MPYRQSLFRVTVTIKAGAMPAISSYRTREEAMNAANAFRSMLLFKQGGLIIVTDPDGKELQTWIEHPIDAHFTQAGGFHI